MNWLADNPVGKALVYVSGALLLVAVIMTIAWSLPLKVAGGDGLADEGGDQAAVAQAREIAALNELQVINQRPVFNENRLPVIRDRGSESEDPSDIDTTIEVQGAPEVNLTGVIITPELKIATLTPTSGQEESVMAHEGEGLVGEYVGWKVAEVHPRTVLLMSNDGQQLSLELQVHDETIKEPPKPVAAPAPAQDAAAQAAALAQAAAARQEAPPVVPEGEQQSRAEQIRQRIAERREQLRLEQEAREAQLQREQAPASGAEQGQATSGRSTYQNAIRDLMRGNRKSDESKDSNNG